MSLMEIISVGLNALLASGGVVMFVTLRSTKRKADAEANRIEIDNDEKSSEVMQTYIVKPLKNEINALRKDVRSLQRAISKIGVCSHADSCPVRIELQNNPDNDHHEC